jgi:putative membrane protein
MGGMMAWGWLVGLLVIALLVGLIVYALSGRRGAGVSSDAMSVLRERYARGEIDETEYDRRARVLRGEAPPRERPG